MNISAFCAAVLCAAAAFAPGGAELDTVIHAGGAVLVDGETVIGSNSLEALSHSVQIGARAVELDFCFTADGELVCVHDWDGYSRVPTREEFMCDGMHPQLTPLDISAVAGFMRENEGFYLVTDIKEDDFERALDAVLSAAGDLRERIIVQIYSEAQYGAVRERGFDHVVYTLYRLSWEEKTDTARIAEFAAGHRLEWIAFSDQLCSLPGYVANMQMVGVPLFIHTVGEGDRELYREMGISGIYTDESR